MLKTYALAPLSLREIWQLSAAHGDRDYLVYEDEIWTYSQAHAEAVAIANWTQAQGIKQDTVALAMRNYLNMLCYWALTSIGVAVVGFNVCGDR